MINLILLTALSFALSYVLLIIYILHHWRKIKPLIVPPGFEPTKKLSLIIAARNEQSSIAQCIKSILANNFPSHLLELIIIDDHSTDDTYAVALAFAECKVIKLKDHLGKNETKAYKKAALKIGIKNATGDYIITTDADTQVNPNWLRTLAYGFEKFSFDFIAAPVVFAPVNTLFSKFEALDFIGMMGVTAAGISSSNWFMANGANMAFSKQEYLKLQPNALNDNFASGDDIFLINAFAKANKKIAFIKNETSIVKTTPNYKLAPFVKQRLRWSTKNKSSKSFSYLLMMSIPYLFSCLLILLLVLGLIWNTQVLFILAFVLLLKLSIDFIYLKNLALDLDQKKLLTSFVPSSLLEVLYISTIGTASLFVKNYTWKGRNIK